MPPNPRKRKAQSAEPELIKHSKKINLISQKEKDVFSFKTKSTHFIMPSKPLKNDSLKLNLQPQFLMIEKSKKPLLMPIDEKDTSDTLLRIQIKYNALYKKKGTKT